MMCLGVGLFGSILFETLCTSWICMCFSFTRLRKFSVIISSNSLSIPWSLSSPSGTPVRHMLLWLLLPQRFLTLYYHFFKSFFSFYCSDWVVFSLQIPHCWCDPLLIQPSIYSSQCILHFIYCILYFRMIVWSLCCTPETNTK